MKKIITTALVPTTTPTTEIINAHGEVIATVKTDAILTPTTVCTPNITKINIDFTTLTKSTMNNTALRAWFHANGFDCKSNTTDDSHDVYNTFATDDRIQLTKKVNHFNLWLTDGTATELETECKKSNIEVFIKPVNDGKRKFKTECDENVMNVFYNLMKLKPVNKMV